MSTDNYSFNEQNFIWAGLNMGQGAATDGWTEARSEGYTTRVAHAAGGHTLNRNTNKGGTVSIVVAPGSQLHADMLALAEAGTPVKDATCTDLSSGRIMTYVRMSIESGGDENRGAPSQANVTWVLSYEKKLNQNPATLSNVIG